MLVARRCAVYPRPMMAKRDAKMRKRAVVACALVIAVGASVAHAQDTARGWLDRGDVALAAWDRVTARQAYEHAAAIAATSPDPRVEAAARTRLADVLLALGERPAAVAQFDALARIHLAQRDRRAAAVAALRAAQAMLDVDRYDEVARRAADFARIGDDDPARRAQMEALRVSAYARGHHADLARQALLESRRDLPPAVWNRFLREEAVRLGAWSGTSSRWLVPALGAFTVAIALSVLLWRRRRVVIAIVGVACLAAVGIAEITLRIATRATADVRYLLHAPSRTATVDGAQVTTNAIGLRGREMPPPGTPRWLAVGGGSVESPGLDDADTWPAVLERALRETHGRDVWIGNAGKSGVTTFGVVSELAAFEDSIAPSLVIVQAGFDDMSLCLSGGRQQVIDMALRYRHADAPAAFARTVFHEIRAPQAASRWRLEALVDGMREGRAIEVVRSDGPTVAPDALRLRRLAAAKIDAMPALDECLRAYAANLRRIADWAEARQVRLVMLTQGSLYRDAITPADEARLAFGSVDASALDDPPPKRYFSVRAMRAMLGRYNDATLAMCAERKLACHDVDTFVPQTGAAYDDDIHVNAAGARMLGAELAKRLAAGGP